MPSRRTNRPPMRARMQYQTPLYVATARTTGNNRTSLVAVEQTSPFAGLRRRGPFFLRRLGPLSLLPFLPVPRAISLLVFPLARAPSPCPRPRDGERRAEGRIFVMCRRMNEADLLRWCCCPSVGPTTTTKAAAAASRNLFRMEENALRQRAPERTSRGAKPTRFSISRDARTRPCLTPGRQRRERGSGRGAVRKWNSHRATKTAKRKDRAGTFAFPRPRARRSERKRAPDDKRYLWRVTSSKFTCDPTRRTVFYLAVRLSASCARMRLVRFR